MTQFTPEDLLALDHEAFKNVVDEDMRNDPEQPGYTPALRTKEVVERWIMVLTQSETSIHSQIVARDEEFNSNNERALYEIEIEQNPAKKKKLELERLERAEAHKRNKFGRLRVQNGIQNTLTEARYVRQQFWPGVNCLIDELHKQSLRCRELETALYKHRADIKQAEIEPSEMDEQLWAHLDAQII